MTTKFTESYFTKGVFIWKNKIEIFKSAEFGQVRTLAIDETPYFVGKGIAEILGYADPQKSIKMHIDNEDKLTRQIVVSGQNREDNSYYR